MNNNQKPPGTIIHTFGKNAKPGHQYEGGVYHVRNFNGFWQQFPYGSPKANCHDTHAQAYKKAQEASDEIKKSL
jgi:hypothetical protein